MAKASPIEFIKQVRNEAKKVTWPSRHETTVSTIAVFIMVFIASVFLYFSDQLISFLVRLILEFGM
ncbi:MAG: preprotein translocase subunit SecE [Micavibrio sp. TMED27]|nr:preprotein translocase subunit SecE [Micavibrio sp.]OUT90554.1 MAG: preprotein translocase subunit SecE [Micavibrio sp. TMED27]|tara:strand:+ start:218 stop:415 length:198 start_codon:yes stop_codon:yes gene_type:complete